MPCKTARAAMSFRLRARRAGGAVIGNARAAQAVQPSMDSAPFPPAPVTSRIERCRVVFLAIVVAASLAALTTTAFAAGDAEAGRALYQTRCTACHSLDYNGVGPAHRGVFGRQAGQAAGFAYSDALKASGLRWNEQSLDRWLSDPEKAVPGQRMGVNVPDARERADLIAYLKSVSMPAMSPSAAKSR